MRRYWINDVGQINFASARYAGVHDETTSDECAHDVNEEVTLAVNPTASEVVVVLLDMFE